MSNGDLATDSTVSDKHAHHRHDVNEIKPADRETREIITPFAFTMEPSLVGIPLASPFRRAIAIAIDAIIIGFTTQLGSVFIALIAAVAAFFSVSKKYFPTQRRWLRVLLKILSGIAILTTFIGVLLNFSDQSFFDAAGVDSSNVTNEERIALESYVAATNPSSCDTRCVREQLVTLQETLRTQDDSKDISELTDDEVALLSGVYHIMNAALESDDDSASIADVVVDASENVIQDNANATIIEGELPSPEEPEEGSYSLLKWAQGLLEDLGLGFGWAAVYFTLFPVLWKGQTPGKRLLGIRVLALSGNYLNIWDSFGRYGGYGAGFATGLLGFFQVYWDPNRQAIHDKISGTVVIRGRPIHDSDTID
ncbi:RDD family protein [uncultured Umboniibacter sp.]|uniref:RDD family protein n=1 Tax=uncultured Umboniibacter sp. TaxID=1798917 RepID=UPI00260DCB8E|nr:RDD family protein [uncultured Umboniibacter sp.]